MLVGRTRNGLCKSIARPCRSDERDWRLARRSRTDGSSRSTSSLDLGENESIGEHSLSYRSALTTVATHAKILRHLDERCIGTLQEVEGDGELLAVPAQHRFNTFALSQGTSDPARVELVAMLLQFSRQAIQHRVDSSRKRVRTVMSLELLQ